MYKIFLDSEEHHKYNVPHIDFNFEKFHHKELI